MPCGAILTNRIAKAAITEGLADPRGWPTEELEGIYDDWGRGNFGLQITGNIIVNGDHLERPGNVVIDGRGDAEFEARLRSWTKTATQHGSHLWAQLSHSGRQTPKFVNARPQSSSPIKLVMPVGLFGTPREMSPLEIEEVIWSFAVGRRRLQAHRLHRPPDPRRPRLPAVGLPQPAVQCPRRRVGWFPREPLPPAALHRARRSRAKWAATSRSA